MSVPGAERLVVPTAPAFPPIALKRLLKRSVCYHEVRFSARIAICILLPGVLFSIHNLSNTDVNAGLNNMNERTHRYGLSKLTIAMFEQCPKRLWLSVHRPELAEMDESSRARFASGQEVGAIACSLLPNGTKVEAKPDLLAALATTRTLLNSGQDQPIFEATLEYDGVLVRIDILEPNGRLLALGGGERFHLGEGLLLRRPRNTALGG